MTLAAFKIAVAGLAFASLAACGANPLATEEASNGFKAERIGTVDGCVIWRIRDVHTVYFAKCETGPVGTKAIVTEACGKGCVRTRPVEMLVAEGAR